MTEKEIKYVFAGDAKGLVDAADKAIDTLAAFEKSLRATAKAANIAFDSSAFEKFSDSILKSVDNVRLLQQQYKEFSKMYESGGFSKPNVIDKYIEQQKAQVKSARESAQAFKELLKEKEAQEKASKKSYFGQEYLSGFRGVNQLLESITQKAHSMADSLTSFGEKASAAGGAVGKLGGAASKAGAALGAIAPYLGVIVAGLTALFSVISKVVSAILKALQKISKALTPVVKLMGQFVAKVLEFSAKLTAGTIFAPVINSLKTLKSELSQNMSSMAQFASGWFSGEWLADATKNAINMIEVQNLFNVAMKDNIKTGNEFVNTLSEMFGLDPTNLQQMTGMFYEMGAAVDLSNDAASKLAMNMTKLSLNVSSLFNVDIEQVSENLISGLRGMSRAVVKYGMDIRATTVEAYTKSLGITQSFETMSEASREIARYIVMVRQAADANSDFSKTINSPANQLRVMKEQALQLSRAIGSFILAAFNRLIPALETTGGLLGLINGVLMSIRLVVEEVARFFGLFADSTPSVSDGLDDVQSGVSGVGSAADKTKKKLDSMLAPFDELNILAAESAASDGASISTSGESGFVDPKLIEELEKTESLLGKVRMKAFKARDAMLKFFGLTYKLKIDPETGEVISKLEKIPGEFADRFTRALKFGDFHAAGFVLGQKLNEAIEYAKELISWDNLGSSITAGITQLTDFISGFVNGFDWNNLGQLIGEGLVTAVNSVNLLLLQTPFSNIGKGLAEMLNGVFVVLTDNPGIVGETIANWLNACVNFASGFANNFQWEAFKTNMVLSIETFFSTFNFEEFLNTASMILNNLVNAMVAAIAAVPWENLGTSIAEMMKRIPWESLIDTSLFMLTQLINAGIAIIQNAPWAMLGSKIAEWIPTLPWADMLKAAETVINSLISAVIQLKRSVNWVKVGKAIANWIEELNWEQLLASVVSAIADTLAGMLQDAIGDLVGSLTGLGNPEDLIRELGGTIVKKEDEDEYGFATGGVVTGPTRALIGEGLYDEAVIPLGNSPQMADLLNKFADVAQQSGNSDVNVTVVIGGKEWDAEIYKSAQRGEKIVGRSPVKEEQ